MDEDFKIKEQEDSYQTEDQNQDQETDQEQAQDQVEGKLPVMFKMTLINDISYFLIDQEEYSPYQQIEQEVLILEGTSFTVRDIEIEQNTNLCIINLH